MPVSRPAMPRLAYVVCASPAGAHRMAYWEWGDPQNDQVLLCIHGLTRNGRDFDILARQLARHFRVVCPDIVGRGKSDWLIDANHYEVGQYVNDVFTLIARLNPAKLHWLGTSMGGLIALGTMGLLAASRAHRSTRDGHGLGAAGDLPLGRLVLNDIGPVLPLGGIQRIANYVGEAVAFASFEEAVAYVRQTSADFGDHDEQGWQDLTRHVFVEQDSQWVKHYDLRIAHTMAATTPEALRTSEALLWQAFEAWPDEVLIIRGEDSDLLTLADAQQMQARRQDAHLLSIPQVGHAPTLRSAAQIDPVETFLTQAL